MQMHSPSHPGLILAEYMGDVLTVPALARHLGITRASLSLILSGRLAVTAPLAIKLAQAFPQSDAIFWLNLQAQYDIARAIRTKRKTLTPVFATAA